jgi:hypothetical protein
MPIDICGPGGANIRSAKVFRLAGVAADRAAAWIARAAAHLAARWASRLFVREGRPLRAPNVFR